MCTPNLNPKNNMLKKVSFTLFSLIFSLSVFALKNDVKQPIHIDADTAFFDKIKGIAVYEGNVKVVQGSLEITANHLEIIAPNNELKKITAKGHPVNFKQKMDDGNIAKGRANQIVYLIKEKRVLMDGNAVVLQNNDNISSNHIEYFIHTGEMKAGSNKKTASKKNRVKVIFFPTTK